MPDYTKIKDRQTLLSELASAELRLEREAKEVAAIKRALAALESSNGGEPGQDKNPAETPALT